MASVTLNPQTIALLLQDLQNDLMQVSRLVAPWFGTCEGFIQGEQSLVVEAIDPPHALGIVAWGNGTLGAGTAGCHARP